MPLNPNIPLGVKQIDINLPRMAATNAQISQANANVDLTKIKTAAARIDALGSVMADVKDPESYSYARNNAIRSGLITPEMAPEQYDPAFIRSASSSIQQQKSQLEMLMKQMQITNMGLQMQDRQLDIQERQNPTLIPINLPGQKALGLNPQQENELNKLRSKLGNLDGTSNIPVNPNATDKGDFYDSYRANLGSIQAQRSKQPQLFKLGKEVVKIDENGNPVSFNPKQGSRPSALQIADELSDPNISKERKDAIREALRKQSSQVGEDEKFKQLSKVAVEQAVELPKTISNSVEILNKVDRTLAEPGFDKNFGIQGKLVSIPGWEAKDAEARIESLLGSAFLSAYDSLRGTGQITQIEGDKATQAILAIDYNTSPQQARAIMQEFRDLVARGAERAKVRLNDISEWNKSGDYNYLLKSVDRASEANLPQQPPTSMPSNNDPLGLGI